MPTEWLYALTSVALVNLISLIGIVTISMSEQRLKASIFVLVSLATGALFGDSFIHLVPEAFAQTNRASRSSILVIAGILAFFVLEKFLRWYHAHTVGAASRIEPGWLHKPDSRSRAQP